MREQNNEPILEPTEKDSEKYAQPRPLRPPNACTYQQNHIRALHYLKAQKSENNSNNPQNL